MGPVGVELVEEERLHTGPVPHRRAGWPRARAAPAPARSCCPPATASPRRRRSSRSAGYPELRHRPRRPEREPQPRRDPPAGRRLRRRRPGVHERHPGATGRDGRRAAASRTATSHRLRQHPYAVRGLVGAVPDMLLELLKLLPASCSALPVLPPRGCVPCGPRSRRQPARPRQPTPSRRGRGARRPRDRQARAAGRSGRRTSRNAGSRASRSRPRRSPSGVRAGCQVTIEGDTFVSQLHAARVHPRRGAVRRGPRLHKRHLPEPTEGHGPMAVQQGDKLQIGNTVLEVA